MNKFFTAAETAKMIRTELKVVFPKVKFSVKTRHMTAIDVNWIDGPTEQEVNAVVAQFKGKRFDGMTDQTSYDNSGHSSYVFVRRTYSVAFLTSQMESVVCKFAVDASAVRIVENSYGARVYDSLNQQIGGRGGQFLSDAIYEAANRVSAAA